MTKSKWSLLLVFGLVLSLFLAACSGDDEKEKTDDTKEETTDPGTSTDTEEPAEVEQVLNFVNGDAIPTMDSSMATDEYAIQFLGASMEGLYRLGENGLTVEGIATEHEVSDDALTWTFHLRQDAKWSNGDPVTANDFVYAWQRAVDPNTGSEYGPYMMGGVVKNATAVNEGEVKVEELGVSAPDDYTFVVELENPTPYFESLTTFATFLPLNQKFVEEKGDAYATSTDNLVFNGPFTLENWESTSSSWELVKNANYWDADTVSLEKLTYEVVKEPQTVVDLYLAGEIDRAGLSSDLVDQYSSHEDYRVEPDTGIQYLKFNQERNGEKTPLANVNIRKAISYAFDKQALVDTILNNGSLVATGIVPTDFVSQPETGEDFRALNGDLSAYNVEEAKKAWEKGLEELGTDTVSLEFLSGDSETAKNMNEYIANQLQTNLEGLEVTLVQVPWEQRLDKDTNEDYDIGWLGWGPDYLDANTWLNLWVTDGGNNHMNYSNPEYDKLIEAAGTSLALDPVKRFEAFQEAEKILFEDAALAPIYQSAAAVLHNPKIEGLIKNQFGPTYEYKWTKVVSVE